MFLYNWQVRADWFEWCKSIPVEELQAERVGGMGSILKNLIHVIDAELLWINYMRKEPYFYPEKKSIANLDLDDVIKFSIYTKKITENFLQNLTEDYENQKLQIHGKGGTIYTFTYGKIIRHVISHEIHHIGQLSIWSRKMDIKPISSDLIIRQFS
jgi:uncharacterized damage-inducible protein DinB